MSERAGTISSTIPDALEKSIAAAEGYRGDIDEASAYALMSASDAAVMIDVRTRAEWAFVGQPDLSALNKPVLALEWVVFPDMAANQDFVPTLTKALEDAGTAPDAPLLFICRSGQRSRAAAMAMTQAGYQTCLNVLGGFEGDKNADGHRGTVNGWKFHQLPWQQG